MGRKLFKNNSSFRANYDNLKEGDCVIGLLNLKPTEESLYLDLSERGIILFPSALSQKISRSKCLQAYVYKRWMVPGTTVIRDRHDMIKAITDSTLKGPVVTKQDRMNCGLGIHIWETVEQVYNQTTFGHLDYPFVLQPFVPNCIDIRVIIIGDYIEAYWRKNTRTFRNNLFFGGDTGHYELKTQELQLCKEVMIRGKFPYAHIDLMVSPDTDIPYLSEINLRGGLKGAKISINEYKKRIMELENEFERRL